jgi:hypothetical protein
MRLGPRHEFLDRAFGRVLRQSLRQWLGRNAGRPERDIEAPAYQRDGQDGGSADHASRPGEARSSRRIAAGLQAQDAPRDLGTGLLGLRVPDQAACGVAVDLAKLVPVNLEIIPRPPARQRQQDRQAGAERQQCGNDPEQHVHLNSHRRPACQHCGPAAD